MRDLTDVLEEIKQMGHYEVHLYFGGQMGEDDSSTPLMQRSCMIIGAPVGFIGEVRRAWVGTVASILALPLDGQPIQLTNPPQRESLDNPGIYAWGAEESITRFIGGNRFEKE